MMFAYDNCGGWVANVKSAPLAAGPAAEYHEKKSPHFWTAASDAPQGMIGTVEVEFFGEPSISLSEYTM